MSSTRHERLDTFTLYGMTRSFTVAAAQLGPSSDTKAQTVERMVGLIQEAGRRDVELLTFSELSLTPYFARGYTPPGRISSKTASLQP